MVTATKAMRRALALAAVTGLLMVIGVAPSAAVPRWAFDAARDIAPPDTPPASVYPMKQTRQCGQSAVLADSQFTQIPASVAFGVDALHAFARGDGQVVAVIDSGVSKVSRLANLTGGGDYLTGSDGLEDCDHHGTLVAGIIAAQPSSQDGFIGVAPGAALISIRQTSGQFTEDTAAMPGAPLLSAADKSAANMLTLAKSIVHAANLGATVINLSLVACVDAGHLPDLRVLAGALKYANVDKNVVIVAAAGNKNGQTCQDNPGYDPNTPTDSRNWTGTQSVALPAYFDDFVLSVGGTTLTGDPYANSMPGPWVGVAAPADNIVSLDPTEPAPGALVNALINEKGEPGPVNGTSYAAAYVSGLAALVRERHPDLTAHQVITRIKATAHTPSNSISNVFGAGIVDPVAALTAVLPPGPPVAAGIPAAAAEKYVPPPPPDTLARNTAALVIAAAVVVLAAATIIGMARRGKSR